MNNAKFNVYKKVLQEVCEMFDGAKEFIRDKIKEICSDEKLSVEEVTKFVYKRLRQLLLKLVVFIKILQASFLSVSLLL